MMCRLLLLTAVMLAVPASAEFSGYIKSFGIVQESIDTPVIKSERIWQSQNSIRLMWQKLGERSAWQMHYEVSPVFRSRTRDFDDATFATASNSYRISDVEVTLNDADAKNPVFQNLDRFNFQLNLDVGDLTVGRQAITFGAARIINPTDVFLPFDVRTFNQEYRIGVDAIRFQYPFGALGEVDAGVILGDGGRADNSAAFFQTRDNIAGYDLQFSIIRFAGQSLTGIGMQSSLWNLGTWFETAHVSGDVDYWRTSLGFDYAFNENVFGMIEFHHNGAGTDDPAEYLQRSTTTPYRQGGIFLLGEAYVIPSLSWQVTALWSLGVQSLYNLSDESAFWSVSSAYSLAQNVYVDLGYYHFTGDKLSLAAGVPVLESEYGPNPDTLYASIRFYF